MTPKRLHIHRLPVEIAAENFAGSTTIVVDILRATSSMTTALANGAKAVVPFAEIEDARNHRESLDGSAKLCGERNWAMIPGFDFGNSPEEYTQNVSGQTFIFTTTNGTRALNHARSAKNIYLGTFLNISAIEKKVSHSDNIQILCSGTKGEPSWEDQLYAGALACRLKNDDWQLNEIANDVMTTWQEFQATASAADDLFHSLCRGTGGSNLVKRGLERDIKYCAQIDIYDVVAEFIPNKNVIQLSC